MFHFILILYSIASATGQVTTYGACPDVPAMAHFDFHQYEGVWFEVEKYYFLPEIVGTCVYVRYKNYRDANATFDADIVQVEKFTRKHIVSPSFGRIIWNRDRSADIDLDVNIIIPLSPISLRVNYPYKILDTDYRNYVIKWHCKELQPGTNTQTIWILSRFRTYPSDLRDFIHQKLRDWGLNPDYLLLSDQNNCPMPRD